MEAGDSPAPPAVEPARPGEAIAPSPGGAGGRPERLDWWHGALGLLIGGVGGQVAGVVAMLVAVILWIASSDQMPSMQEMQSELFRNFGVLAPTVVATGLTMAVVALAAPLIARVPLRPALGLKGAPWPVFLAAPIGILALGPTSDAMRRLMERFLPDFTIGALEGLDQLARSGPLWAILPVMALVPGISEELLFRGMFQRSVRRPLLALVLSGVLFAGYHLDPHHVVAVLPLGLYLAWLGHRTDSVTVPITAHVVNNAAAVLGSRYLVDPLAGEPTPNEWWWVPAGWAVAVIAIGVVFWSTRERPAPPPGPATF